MTVEVTGFSSGTFENWPIESFCSFCTGRMLDHDSDNPFASARRDPDPDCDCDGIIFARMGCYISNSRLDDALTDLLRLESVGSEHAAPMRGHYENAVSERERQRRYD